MPKKDFLCPFCNGNNFIKYGMSNGKQKYKCSCGRYFTHTTHTIFSSTKLPKDKLVKLIVFVLNDTKMKTIQDILDLSSRTVYIWRIKIFKAAGDIIKSTILSNVVWIDEKLVRVNKRFLILKNNGKNFAGTSKNQVTIACAVDATGNKYAEVIGRGRISSNQCIKSYGKHIKKGSFIYHDGIYSHDKLIAHLKSNHRVCETAAKDSKKLMQPINTFCSEIERNLVIHQGTRTENLQDYLNWIVFRSTITKENISAKVNDLYSRCVEIRTVYRVKDRYKRQNPPTKL